jgi:hypothetical protein
MSALFSSFENRARFSGDVLGLLFMAALFLTILIAPF